MQRKEVTKSDATPTYIIQFDKNTYFPNAMIFDAKEFTAEISPNRTSINISACTVEQGDLLITKRRINIGKISSSGNGVINNVYSYDEVNSFSVIVLTTRIITKTKETLGL